MVTTLQQSDYTQCQSTVYVTMVRVVHFPLCIFYFKQASKPMFLPKRNEQAGSYQGRSTQENGTLLADDDVFISHCRHVGPSGCAGAHDHGYLESKHTGDSAPTVNTASGSAGPRTVPGHVTSWSLCCLCFLVLGGFWSALCGLQDLSSWPGIKPRSWQKSLES